MSKRNMLIGTAAGKVGDLVFYRAGGEQRTRARVVPNNPKSYAQQAQRSRIANVTAIYRALSALLKDTFPNRPSNQTPFSAFSAEALPLAPYLNKEAAQQGMAILQPCTIAKGSVPTPFNSIGITLTEVKAYMDTNITQAAFTAATTIGKLSELLIADRPCAFMQGGKLIIAVLAAAADENPDVPVARYYVLPIDTEDETLLSAAGITPSYVAASEGLPASIIFTAPGGGDHYGAGAVIVAPKVGGGHDVTTAQLGLVAASLTAYEAATTEAAAKAAAISYGGCQGSCVVNG